MNTGTQDREGYTVFKGPRGGLFVRRGLSRTKVYRKTLGSRMTDTGRLNAMGRMIMRGPRGGLFILLKGQRRNPAKGPRKGITRGEALLAYAKKLGA